MSDLLSYAHRIVGSPGGKHCKSLQRNVWRGAVSPLRLDSPGCWEGPLPCCTCSRIDVNQLANNNDVVDQLSLDWLQILDLSQNVLKEA